MEKALVHDHAISNGNHPGMNLEVHSSAKYEEDAIVGNSYEQAYWIAFVTSAPFFMTSKLLAFFKSMPWILPATC